MTKNNKTHFGFKDVNKSDKTHLVKNIFSNVAEKYDLMNDLMSASIHRLWKIEMVKHIDFCVQGKKLRNYEHKFEIIDLAGGTGDIAFRIAKKAKTENINCHINVVDINKEMLEVGKKRNINCKSYNNIDFICQDGENLQFKDNYFDYFTIAFGIRNFTDINRALSEAYRVLKPGGKFICLEFSKVNDYFLQKIYNFYSFKIIPKIGELILNDRDSYQYLVESIRKFPNQENFAKMISENNFKNVSYKNLTFGTVAIHIGQK